MVGVLAITYFDGHVSSQAAVESTRDALGTRSSRSCWLRPLICQSQTKVIQLDALESPTIRMSRILMRNMK